ncbi:MAG: hypothetical protein Q8924_12295 [Bacillota bacterium]|nr:hypothetical protein [Bacillota bacterium]
MEENQLTTRASFSLVPSNLNEAMQLAKLISESDLAPKDYRGKPGNVLIAVQMGQDIGLGAMSAIQSIAVINGKPSLYGDVGKAILLSKGFTIEEDDIRAIKDKGFATCTIKRPGHPPCTRTFGIENAKTAKLWGKEGPWSTNPERQMAWRAFWFAARDNAADVLKGLSGAEEVVDYLPEKDITPAPVAISEQKPERKTMTIEELTSKYTKDKTDDDGVVTKFSPKSMIERGDETAQNLIDFLAAKYNLPAEVVEVITSWTPGGES